MFNSLSYYTELIKLDLKRLPSATIPQVAIVTGVCLPIFLLLGLTNGHIREMYEKLDTTPSGREIKISSKSDSELLTASMMDSLQKELKPDLDVLMPVAKNTVSLLANSKHAEAVTLIATRQGDQKLSRYDIAIPQYPQEGRPQITVSRYVADTIGIEKGNHVTMRIKRRFGKEETADIEVEIADVYSFEDEKKMMEDNSSEKSETGCAPFELLADLKCYQKGYSVKRYGWPSASPPPPEYIRMSPTGIMS